MSRFDTINRYLGGAVATDGKIMTDPANGYQFRQLNKTTLPAKLDRQCIDKEEDDITHPAFQPVLSDLLPGHRFVHKYSSLPSDAYRTSKIENLQYTRFWEHDLTIKKDAKGVPNRTKHFWNRLFRSLPWSCADQKEMGFVQRLDFIVFSFPCNPSIARCAYYLGDTTIVAFACKIIL